MRKKLLILAVFSTISLLYGVINPNLIFGTQYADTQSSFSFYIGPPLNTSVDPINPYEQSSSPLTINATGNSSLANVSLYYRWSNDNSSWITWSLWDNLSNPDTSSPWSWNFDFPNSTGYYEFYSISKNFKDTESTPSSADAICYYNP